MAAQYFNLNVGSSNTQVLYNKEAVDTLLDMPVFTYVPGTDATAGWFDSVGTQIPDADVTTKLPKDKYFVVKCTWDENNSISPFLPIPAGVKSTEFIAWRYSTNTAGGAALDGGKVMAFASNTIFVAKLVFPVTNAGGTNGWTKPEVYKQDTPAYLFTMDHTSNTRVPFQNSSGTILSPNLGDAFTVPLYITSTSRGTVYCEYANATADGFSQPVQVGSIIVDSRGYVAVLVNKSGRCYCIAVPSLSEAAADAKYVPKTEQFSGSAVRYQAAANQNVIAWDNSDGTTTATQTAGLQMGTDGANATVSLAVVEDTGTAQGTQVVVGKDDATLIVPYGTRGTLVDSSIMTKENVNDQAVVPLKTINGTSLHGAGAITINAIPSVGGSPNNAEVWVKVGIMDSSSSNYHMEFFGSCYRANYWTIHGIVRRIYNSLNNDIVCFEAYKGISSNLPTGTLPRLYVMTDGSVWLDIARGVAITRNIWNLFGLGSWGSQFSAVVTAGTPMDVYGLTVASYADCAWRPNIPIPPDTTNTYNLQCAAGAPTWATGGVVVPTPPTTAGTYNLQSVTGALSWASPSQPPSTKETLTFANGTGTATLCRYGLMRVLVCTISPSATSQQSINIPAGDLPGSDVCGAIINDDSGIKVGFARVTVSQSAVYITVPQTGYNYRGHITWIAGL